MITINTVSSTKFSFNGVNYLKNFTPIVVGNKIRILNTYDSKIELTDEPTLFSDFTVDGNTFANVALLQDALLTVIFTRSSLSGGGSGSSTFTSLTDAPSSYTGQANKVVSVKADESGLEFTNGGGGTSLKNNTYHWNSGNNTFATTSNWYGARRNVASQLPTPLWSSGESYYDGVGNIVTNVRTPSYALGFDQNVDTIIISYENTTVYFTFRLVYYELNPSGSSNEGINAHIIHENTISANTGGIKKQTIITPTAFTCSSGGYLALFILNNSGSTLTAPTWSYVIETTEVI